MGSDQKTSELEVLYGSYFVPEEIDENESLLQPSPLKHVDSFATYEISDDLLICEGKH